MGTGGKMHHQQAISKRISLWAVLCLAVLTVSVMGNARATAYDLDIVLYAVEPGVAVKIFGDTAAENAAERAANYPGLSVYPVTRGDIIIGDSTIRMQGPELGWTGDGLDIQILASEGVQLGIHEETRFEWGHIPAAAPNCQGPQVTPVFAEALGYAIDADAYLEEKAGRIDAYMLFEYAVDTLDGPEIHRFSLHRIGPAGNWAAIVKAMPDGGHLILFHRLSPLD